MLRLRRSGWFALPLLLVAALTTTGAASGAGEPTSLDAALRSELAALPRLAGPQPQLASPSNRAVVVSFFASWCPPCRVEFAHLNELVGEFPPESLEVVAVNVYEDFFEDGQDEARLHRFLTETAPGFSVVRGNESVRHAFGDVDRIPTVFVFDPEGRAVMHFVHRRGAAKTSTDLEELRAAVAEALKQ